VRLPACGLNFGGPPPTIVDADAGRFRPRQRQ
jgi:hypothetical protein